MKRLWVLMTFPPTNTGEENEFIDLDDTETEDDLKEIAADTFRNRCSYGYQVEEMK